MMLNKNPGCNDKNLHLRRQKAQKAFLLRFKKKHFKPVKLKDAVVMPSLYIMDPDPNQLSEGKLD